MQQKCFIPVYLNDYNLTNSAKLKRLLFATALE